LRSKRIFFKSIISQMSSQKISRNMITRLLISFFTLLMISCVSKSDIVETRNRGLIGAYCGNDDFTNIKEAEILTNLDQEWDEETGHGSSWSGKWQGMLISPATDSVEFELVCSKSAKLTIDKKEIAVTGGSAKMKLKMTLSESMPIQINYQHTRGADTGILQVLWAFNDQEKTIIPADRIYFTREQGIAWNYMPEPRESELDPGKFKRVSAKHVIVYDEPGKFCGWPANNGIWVWENEILVGFTLAHYQEKELHHSVDETKPSLSVLARSKDGGETWQMEDPDNFMGDGGSVRTLDQPIQFAHPNFALRCNGLYYYFSYDRGKTWQGPFKFPNFGQNKITSRTDYIVSDDNTCYFFFSAEEKKVQARLQDQTFCAVTKDGGLTYTQLGWIGQPITTRAAMPSSVRISDTHIITALRRRFDEQFPDKPKSPKNWIDVYESGDNGESWKFLSKVAETDMGKHNGNPPSLVKLKDGRLVLTYGYRALPYGIRAKISSDNGKTWSEVLHIRDDGRTFDLGYTRTVQRSDAKLVTIYYYTTKENPEQHIAASIWEPDNIHKYQL
jgi:hypothetical protein